MTPAQLLAMIAELLGGLAFFLYGMSMLSGNLQNLAGGRLEQSLKKVTAAPLSGFFLSAGITVAIQSSSAMTVMLVSLVEAGILPFAATFSMILGADVGTTLTAWLLSLTGIGGSNFFLTLLKPMTFAPLLAFAGILIRMLSKERHRQQLGDILIGFAILMTGMDFMSSSMSGIQGAKGFQQLLTAFRSPVLALLIATLFTGVIQSSAATVGIVQALALTGSIPLQTAIPLILGANIGTCVTALLSCFGTGSNAKRVVALHVTIKIVGSVLCLFLLYGLSFTGAAFLNRPVTGVTVALLHTLFNVANTLLMIPLKRPVLQLCMLTIPEKSKKKDVNSYLSVRESASAASK